MYKYMVKKIEMICLRHCFDRGVSGAEKGRGRGEKEKLLKNGGRI